MFKNIVSNLIKDTDIEINGKRPWDVKIHNEKFYRKIVLGGSLALGESYMDGWWDCDRLDLLVEKLRKNNIDQIFNFKFILFEMVSKLLNAQSKLRSFQVGKTHYDLDNNLYSKMLDRRRVYSCGYFKNTNSLDKAQEQKLDLICKKLKLKPDMTVLEIGCGWGSFAKFAAEKYKVKVVGLTVSIEQAKLAKEYCKGLDVEIKVQDYREEKGKYDRVLSIGMFEHVGYKNYREYFKLIDRCLNKGGLSLLHTIGGNVSQTAGDPWSDKYIFPNGMLPSIKQIGNAIEGLFIVEDWHNFGPDYAKTLIEWDKNFRKAWPELSKKYDERFYRMWRFYLLGFAGSFKARSYQLWQIVLSRGDIDNYESIR